MLHLLPPPPPIHAVRYRQKLLYLPPDREKETKIKVKGGYHWGGGEGVKANSDYIKTDVVFLIVLVLWHHGSDSCMWIAHIYERCWSSYAAGYIYKVQYVAVRLAV